MIFYTSIYHKTDTSTNYRRTGIFKPWYRYYSGSIDVLGFLSPGTAIPCTLVGIFKP